MSDELGDMTESSTMSEAVIVRRTPGDWRQPSALITQHSSLSPFPFSVLSLLPISYLLHPLSTPINAPIKTMSTGAPWAHFYHRIFDD